MSCDLSGTSLTNIKTVARQGTETAGLIRPHRIGATVSLTDFAHLKVINDLVSGAVTFNASVPLGYDGTASITTANQFATKAYIDGIAVAGAPDASTSTKGIARVSVAPASASIPIGVGDNDNRVPTQAENDALIGTTGTPSSANKYVTETDTAFTGTVKTTGDQSVGGIKTFTSIPVLPASDPVGVNDAVRKSYVDGLVATSSGSTLDSSHANGTYYINWARRGKLIFGLYMQGYSNVNGGIGFYPDTSTINRIASKLGVTASGATYNAKSTALGGTSGGGGEGNSTLRWSGSAWVDTFNSQGTNQYTEIFLSAFMIA